MMSESDVREVIQDIPDPCSLATGVPLGIGEMGLIQAIECREGGVTVRLHITSPMCMMAAYFMREIEQRLGARMDPQGVKVEFDHALEWTPAHISADARQRLLDRRIRTLGGRQLSGP
ncbi:metal-sulfur cluster assembly factor [Melittangium boletus]|uniref:MIP18 family-like domain-containing protein n=1 Tax=Melittangium boletus DSM 14713 TaxID=1294270 RepID=A0A250IPI3_9BACT|nr:iron-sulfur cluster assembly protein [Melittangium boletus]ATB33659.1 hypothetical protein MEBOL_007157 [Melittangium boletus DSM 14713]